MPGFTTDLGRLAHDLPDALAMLDSARHVSWLNGAALDLLGAAPTDWLGRPVMDLIDPAHHDLARAVVGGTASATGSRSVGLRMRVGAGTWRELRVASRTVPPTPTAEGFVVMLLRDG